MLTGKNALYEGRHDFRCRPVDRIVELAGALRRFEIEFDCARTVSASFSDETSSGIDVPTRSDRNEEISRTEKSIDPAHLVRHLGKPDDVRAHAAGKPAEGTRGVNGEIVVPRKTMLAEGAKRLEQFTMHMDQRF